MMLVETDYLIVRHDPAIGDLIRTILTKNQGLIAPAAGRRRQWQERDKICRVIVPNWPDPPDEGATGRFRYSVDEMIRELQAVNASIEAKGKAT